MTVDTGILLECDWNKDFVIAYMFKTGMLRTLYGHEQRSALMAWPRRTVKYNVTFMSESDSAYFTRIMSKYQGQVFGVPVWAEQGILTAQAPAAQAYVDLTDVDKMNFEVGGLAVLYQDRSTYEIMEIDSKTTTRLNLTSGLASTWEAGSIVYPMLHMTVNQTIPYRKMTSAYGGASLLFKEAWESTIVKEIGSHSFPLYQGYPVFNKEPNWVNNFGMSIGRPYDYLQKMGVQIRYVRETESEFTLDVNYLSFGIDECYELRSFFHNCMGKWKQFWVPSWQRDVVVTGAISASDAYLTIEDIEFSSYWATNNIIGKHLFLILPDGTELYRKVIGWPTATQLNLDTSIGQDVDAAAVGVILASFLMPARFEVDEMEERYKRTSVSETRVRIQSLYDENMTTTTT